MRWQDYCILWREGTNFIWLDITIFIIKYFYKTKTNV